MIKRIIAISLLALLLFGLAAVAQEKKLEGRKALMVIASNNFRDEEYSIPRKKLEEQGAKITVASSKMSESIGMLKKEKVKPDTLVSEVSAEDFDAVVFIGGVGAKEYFKDRAALKLAKEAYEKKKIVAAICLAPMILGNAGILKDKKATVYASEATNLGKCGAKYTGSPIEVDGNIITANGPAAADKFAEALEKALYGFKILTGRKIAMIIAPKDFRDEELSTPRKIFLENGADVVVASSTSRECKGMLGMKFKPDTTTGRLKPEDFDAIVFIGGAGAKDFFDDRKLHRLAEKAHEKGKVVAAICIAPVILANAGLLKDRDATVFSAMKDKLEEKGASYKEEAVVSDGRIVTGNGPEAAEEFANEVVKKIRE